MIVSLVLSIGSPRISQSLSTMHLKDVEIALQTISMLFAALGIVATVAAINCDNSVAAVLYRRLAIKGKPQVNLHEG
jgi:hypothetical protein